MAWPKAGIAIEIQGGIWAHAHGKRGGHSGGAGQLRDMEKSNEAQRLGWKVFQFTPEQIRDGYAMLFMRRVL